MQVKLLRAIQEKKVRKVGSASEESVDVRILCATHQRLKARVDAGQFRQDLYYRLNVIELKMPALRERKEDIPALVAAALRRICGEHVPAISTQAMQALCDYSYPGNVRELENILERANALCSHNQIDVDDLQLSPIGRDGEDAVSSREGESLDEHMNRIERQLILEALAKTGAKEDAQATMATASGLLDKAARKGIIHKNAAARKKSRLAKRINAMA